MAFVTPDVLVDGFVADPKQAKASENATHLLRAQVSTKQHLDEAPMLSGEVTVTARSRSTTVRGLLRALVSIRAVRVGCVPAELTANGAAVPAEHVRDLRVRQSLFSERGERIPLLGSDLTIRHDDTFLPEDSSVSQIAPSYTIRCCTYFLNSRRLTFD
jgi:hypothetical protein